MAIYSQYIQKIESALQQDGEVRINERDKEVLLKIIRILQGENIELTNEDWGIAKSEPLNGILNLNKEKNVVKRLGCSLMISRIEGQLRFVDDINIILHKLENNQNQNDELKSRIDRLLSYKERLDNLVAQYKSLIERLLISHIDLEQLRFINTNIEKNKDILGKYYEHLIQLDRDVKLENQLSELDEYDSDDDKTDNDKQQQIVLASVGPDLKNDEPSYYEILDVARDATVDEIKKGYKARAIKTHPDKNGGDDTEFKRVGEAYEVLTNEKYKQLYDDAHALGDTESEARVEIRLAKENESMVERIIKQHEESIQNAKELRDKLTEITKDLEVGSPLDGAVEQLAALINHIVSSAKTKITELGEVVRSAFVNEHSIDENNDVIVINDTYLNKIKDKIYRMETIGILGFESQSVIELAEEINDLVEVYLTFSEQLADNYGDKVVDEIDLQPQGFPERGGEDVAAGEFDEPHEEGFREMESNRMDHIYEFEDKLDLLLNVASDLAAERDISNETDEDSSNSQYEEIKQQLIDVRVMYELQVEAGMVDIERLSNILATLERLYFNEFEKIKQRLAEVGKFKDTVITPDHFSDMRGLRAADEVLSELSSMTTFEEMQDADDLLSSLKSVKGPQHGNPADDPDVANILSGTDDAGRVDEAIDLEHSALLEAELRKLVGVAKEYFEIEDLLSTMGESNQNYKIIYHELSDLIDEISESKDENKLSVDLWITEFLRVQHAYPEEFKQMRARLDAIKRNADVRDEAQRSEVSSHRKQDELDVAKSAMLNVNQELTGPAIAVEKPGSSVSAEDGSVASMQDTVGLEVPKDNDLYTRLSDLTPLYRRCEFELASYQALYDIKDDMVVNAQPGEILLDSTRNYIVRLNINCESVMMELNKIKLGVKKKDKTKSAQEIDEYIRKTREMLDETSGEVNRLYAEKMTDEIVGLISQLNVYLADEEHNVNYSPIFNENIKQLRSIIMEHRKDGYLHFDNQKLIRDIRDKLSTAKDYMSIHKTTFIPTVNTLVADFEKYLSLSDHNASLDGKFKQNVDQLRALIVEHRSMTLDDQARTKEINEDIEKMRRSLLVANEQLLQHRELVKKAHEALPVVVSFKQEQGAVLSHQVESLARQQKMDIERNKAELISVRKGVQEKMRQRVDTVDIPVGLNDEIKRLQELLSAQLTIFDGRVNGVVNLNLPSSLREGSSTKDVIMDGISKINDIIKELGDLYLNGFKYGRDSEKDIKKFIKIIDGVATKLDASKAISASDLEKLVIEFEMVVEKERASMKANVFAAKMKLQNELISESNRGKKFDRKAVIGGRAGQGSPAYIFHATDVAYDAYADVERRLLAVANYVLDANSDSILSQNAKMVNDIVEWAPHINEYTRATGILIELMRSDIANKLDDPVNELNLLYEELISLSKKSFSDPMIEGELTNLLKKYSDLVSVRILKAKDVDFEAYFSSFITLKNSCDTLESDIIRRPLQVIVEEHQNDPAIIREVKKRELLAKLDVISKTDIEGLLNPINQWENYLSKADKTSDAYKEIDATFKSQYYSGALSRHQDLITLTRSRLNEMVDEAGLLSLEVLTADEIDLSLINQIEVLYSNLQEVTKELSSQRAESDRLRKEAHADIRQLESVERRLNSLINIISRSPLTTLKEQKRVCGIFKNKLEGYKNKLADTVDLSVAANLAEVMESPSKRANFRKALENILPLSSPALYFDSAHFNSTKLRSIKDDPEEMAIFTHLLYQVPDKYWAKGSIDVDAVIRECTKENPDIDAIQKIVKFDEFRFALMVEDDAYDAAIQFQDNLLNADRIVSMLAPKYFGDLLNADNTVNESRMSEFKAFLESIPDDYYKIPTNKEGVINNLIKLASQGKLTKELLSKDVFIKKYHQSIMDKIIEASERFDDVLTMQLSDMSQYIGERDREIIADPRHLVFDEAVALRDNILKHKPQIHRDILINNYAMNSQSIGEMAERHFEAEKLYGEVEGFLEKHKSVFSEKATAVPKSKSKLADKIADIESKLEIKSPESTRKPQEKVVVVSDLAPAFVERLEKDVVPSSVADDSRQVPDAKSLDLVEPSMSLIVQHLQKWKEKSSGPSHGRAFMISSKGHDPELDDGLKKLIEKDAKQLASIMSRPVTCKDDITQLNHDLSEYFQSINERVINALNNHPKFKDVTPAQKYEYYFSYVSSIKADTLNQMLGGQPTQIDLSKSGSRVSLIDAYLPNLAVSSISSDDRLKTVVPIVDNAVVLSFKEKEAMYNLIGRLEMMMSDYKQIGKTKHVKEMEALIAKLKEGNVTPDAAVQLVQKEFDRQRQSAKSLFGIRFSRQSFADIVNQDEKHYHYPRMLAIALEATYKENQLLIPGSPEAPRLTSKVNVPQTEVYRKYEPAQQNKPVMPHPGGGTGTSAP